jgi:hypothetical protein
VICMSSFMNQAFFFLTPLLGAIDREWLVKTIYGFSSFALRVDTSNNFATLFIFLHLSLHMILFKDNSAHLQVIPSENCTHVYHVIHSHNKIWTERENKHPFVCFCVNV